MNTQQTADLSTWLKNQEQPLPESLASILIEDCLEELKNSEEARKRLDLLSPAYSIYLAPHFDPYKRLAGEETLNFNFKLNLEGKMLNNLAGWRTFDGCSGLEQLYIIQTLLSQKDGEAVIPFLDVENKEIELEYKKRGLDKIKFGGKDLQLARLEFSFWAKEQPKTLQEKLLKEFVLNGTGIGKTFEEAWEIITKIYLVQRYV
jgi:hypothetical protein